MSKHRPHSGLFSTFGSTTDSITQGGPQSLPFEPVFRKNFSRGRAFPAPTQKRGGRIAAAVQGGSIYQSESQSEPPESQLSQLPESEPESQLLQPESEPESQLLLQPLSELLPEL